MAALSISRAWEETKAQVAADGRLMAIVAAAFLALPQAIVSLVAPPEQLSGEAAPGGLDLLVLLVAVVGIIGEIAIATLAIRSGRSVGEAMSHGAKRMLPAVASAFLVGVAIFLVAVPLLILFVGASALESAAGTGATAGAALSAVGIIIVLGIVIGARFLLIIPVAAAEPGGPIHMLKRSWTLASGHYFRLLAVTCLIAVTALIAAVALQFGAGSIIALFFRIHPLSVGALLYGLLLGGVQACLAVVFLVMISRMYLQLNGGAPLKPSVPSSGT